MSRFFTCYWMKGLWRPDCNPPDVPLRAAGSSKFTERGVVGGRGHTVYVVSLSGGRLYLGGRMTVSRIVSRARAGQITGSDNLYEAPEWVIDDEGGTPLHLHRRLAPELSRRVLCIRAGGEERGLVFLDDDNLDGQAARGVQELTSGTAALFDRIIAVTDAMPRDGRPLTVTAAMLGDITGG